MDVKVAQMREIPMHATEQCSLPAPVGRARSAKKLRKNGS